MWPMIAMAVVSAAKSASQYSAASAATKAGKRQQAYNDKNNRISLALTSTVIDTNLLRARTEATDAVGKLRQSQAEAAAYAQVQAASTGIIQGAGGSFDTILNSFARKTNEQTSDVMESLTSTLMGGKLQRIQAAFQASTQQSTVQYNSPSALGYAANGAADYFKSTYGLWGSGSAAPVDQVAAGGSSQMDSPLGLPGRSSLGGSQLFTR